MQYLMKYKMRMITKMKPMKLSHLQNINHTEFVSLFPCQLTLIKFPSSNFRVNTEKKKKITYWHSMTCYQVPSGISKDHFNLNFLSNSLAGSYMSSVRLFARIYILNTSIKITNKIVIKPLCVYIFLSILFLQCAIMCTRSDFTV